MDWTAAEAGYVIAAYAVSALGILGLILWCLLRDIIAAAKLRKRQ